MTNQEADIAVTNELRTRLMRFINRREKAYLFIRKKGITVPDYATKQEAIKDIRRQLEVSINWSLRSHLLWICAKRDQIKALLPYEFHDDPSQVNLRKSILDLINYCDDRLNTKMLLNLKLKAA